MSTNYIYISDDNVIVSKITTNNEMHDNKDLNWYKNKMCKFYILK